jgi:hypothetical protein
MSRREWGMEFIDRSSIDHLIWQALNLLNNLTNGGTFHRLLCPARLDEFPNSILQSTGNGPIVRGTSWSFPINHLEYHPILIIDFMKWKLSGENLMLSEEMFTLRDHWAIPRNTHTRKRRHRLLGYCAHDCRLQKTAAQEPAILMSLLIGVSKWRSPRWLWNLSQWPSRNQLGKLCLMV